MSALDAQCTLLVHHEVHSAPRQEELRAALESKDEGRKAEALKEIVVLTANGEKLDKMLMPVIKYCLHTENHAIKKLLLLFWECVSKKSPEGTLRPEMILVCNAMKNNLVHPNEYIRGSTLRFLCSMKEAEILESLVPSITANLDHRHSYVRKNAVLAVLTVYQSHPDLIPDAPVQVEKLLYAEQNASVRRNAFLMLFQTDQERALKYLNTILDSAGSAGDSMQLVMLELIRRVCRQHPALKPQYVRCIYELASSPSHAVSYEAANTLVSLSAAPTAVRTAVAAYCRLLSAESDNNVKLIILGRLSSLRRRHERIVQDAIMDILRSLSSPNIDIRTKTLSLALEVVTPRNVDDVVQVLRKEIVKTEAPEFGRAAADQYRKLLVDALHRCAVRFPEVAPPVVQVLMNYLGDDSVASSAEVIYFVREMVEQHPKLRDDILEKLLDSFSEIRQSMVFRMALWILAEYCTELPLLTRAIETVRDALGEIPFPVRPLSSQEEEEEERKAKEAEDGKSAATTTTAAGATTAARGASTGTSAPAPFIVTSRPVVLPDGTYAQQSSVAEAASSQQAAAAASVSEGVALRSLIVDGGDFFLGAVLATTMTKMLLRLRELRGPNTAEINAEIAKGLLLMTSILRLGHSRRVKVPIDKDSHGRITHCIRTLLNPEPFKEIFLRKTRETLHDVLKDRRAWQQSLKDDQLSLGPMEEKKALLSQVDDLISIRHLKGATQLDAGAEEDEEISHILTVVAPEDKAAQLNRVFQLTGFGDPVYAEAHLTVLEYDIVLDVWVKNQTSRVLQNLTIELSTSRDLKIVERPQSFNVAPGEVATMKVNVKVTATESGVIFGNIVYDSASGSNQTIVVLNSVHMDIIDYIRPATCSYAEFRSMWAEFEWENKICITTDIMSLDEYLEHIIKITNMQRQAPDVIDADAAGFLVANLYARSIFGEDALLNVSAEKTLKGGIHGFIRVRCKDQGIALSLGDKITNYQRSHK